MLYFLFYWVGWWSYRFFLVDIIYHSDSLVANRMCNVKGGICFLKANGIKMASCMSAYVVSPVLQYLTLVFTLRDSIFAFKLLKLNTSFVFCIYMFQFCCL